MCNKLRLSLIGYEGFCKLRKAKARQDASYYNDFVGYGSAITLFATVFIYCIYYIYYIIICCYTVGPLVLLTLELAHGSRVATLLASAQRVERRTSLRYRDGHRHQHLM